MSFAIDRISFPSGMTIHRPGERLLTFCAEEYAYYDAIASNDPNRIEPIDVLATVAVNAFPGMQANAAHIRKVHRGLAGQCDRLLSEIAPDADLLSAEALLAPVEALLHAAVQVPGVLVPVASKVLHRKRPHLIPMLDNVVLEYYLKAMGQSKLWSRTQSKPHAASVAVAVLGAFRDDLRQTHSRVAALQERLGQSGYPLSLVRIVELLVWTEVEPNGYYRATPSTDRTSR